MNINDSNEGIHIQHGPRAWLSDTQIKMALQIIDTPGHTYPTTESILIMRLTNINKGKSPEGTLIDLKTQNLFIPTWKDNHWKAIMINHTTKQIYTFDPLGNAFSYDTFSLLQMCFPTYEVTDLKLKLQTDSTNCGLWILFMAFAWKKYTHQNNIPLTRHINNEMEKSTPKIYNAYDATTEQQVSNTTFIQNLRLTLSTRILHETDTHTNPPPATPHT
jgi:hypothetical protein